MAAADVVHEYVSALPGSTRRLAHAEWGVTVDAEAAAGWPLDIGLRIADGLLRAQAFVAGHDEMLDPWLFLAWNRQTRYVRFGCARNGDIWIHGDLPVEAVDARAVDRLLGLLAEGAAVARRYASDAREARPAVS
jgi:hypothetical protein